MRGESESTAVPIILRDVPRYIGESEADCEARALEALDLMPTDVQSIALERKSLDTRGKNPHFQCHFLIHLKAGPRREKQLIADFKDDRVAFFDRADAPPPSPGHTPLPAPIYVIGAGPAGLFAALRLAQAGFKPILVERGKDVLKRGKDIAEYWRSGKLDPDSNVVFGEGGAGTYSDGKLTTRIHTPLVREVFKALHAAGAQDEIMVDAHPHIGTDRLHHILRKMRTQMESLGVTYQFDTKLTGLTIADGRLTHIDLNGVTTTVGAVILAAGASARDLYRILLENGVAIESRASLVGLRVEHPQSWIDKVQLKNACGVPGFGPAEYFLKRQPSPQEQKQHLRAVHSFCMCPGGMVLPLSTEPDGVACNGMSNSARGSGWGNAALIVPVKPADYEKETGDQGPLCGIDFQRKYERIAYQLGGGDHRIPAMRLTAFQQDTKPDGLPDGPRDNWRRQGDLRESLPRTLLRSIHTAIADWDKRYHGFLSPDATIYGSEMRTGAVVRIPRDEDGPRAGEAINVANLYPCGEGAGYAGGITSAAADGLRQADQVIRKFQPA